MRLKITKGNIFYILYTILMILVFTKYVFEANVSITLLLIVFCAAALVANKSELVGLALTCIPLNSSFQYSYALIFALIVYCIKYHKYIRLHVSFFVPVLISIVEILHDIAYGNSILSSMKVVIPVFLAFCIVYDESIREVRCKNIFSLLCVSNLVMSMVVFTKTFFNSNNNILTMFQYGYRFGVIDDSVEIMGANFNPNFLGFMCIITICLCLHMIENEGSNLIYYIFTVMSAVFGLLTMSRTFVLCLVIVLFIFVISRKNYQLLLYMALFLIAAFVIYTIMARNFSDILLSFTSRFKVQDLSNGRNDLFGEYNKLIFGSISILLYGVGVTGLNSFVENNSVAVVPHNGIQELLLLWGVLCTILIMYMIILFIHKAKYIRSSRPTILNYMLITAFFVKTMAGQFMSFAPNSLILIVCFLSLVYEANVNKTSNQMQTIN